MPRRRDGGRRGRKRVGDAGDWDEFSISSGAIIVEKLDSARFNADQRPRGLGESGRAVKSLSDYRFGRRRVARTSIPRARIRHCPKSIARPACIIVRGIQPTEDELVLLSSWELVRNDYPVGSSTGETRDRNFSTNLNMKYTDWSGLSILMGFEHFRAALHLI